MSDLDKTPDLSASVASHPSPLPSVMEIEAELARVKGKRGTRRAVAGFFGVLIVVAAAAALVSTQLMPVMRMQGDSMEPTLNSGDVVASLNVTEVEAGDIVAFEHDGRVLVKRVLAVGGDVVDVNEMGTVLVNGAAVSEPYVVDKSLGRTNVALPCEVSEGSYFVMGDNRAVSIDSRNTAVGFVEESQLIGELFVRVYPFDAITLL